MNSYKNGKQTARILGRESINKTNTHFFLLVSSAPNFKNEKMTEKAFV